MLNHRRDRYSRIISEKKPSRESNVSVRGASRDTTTPFAPRWASDNAAMYAAAATRRRTRRHAAITRSRGNAIANCLKVTRI